MASSRQFKLWLVALALGGCAVESATDPLSATGELVALSGGEAGAAAACFTCHGLQGQGAGLTPRLAGLDGGYLERQLGDYATGLRDDKVMGPIARSLDAPARQAVSYYYAAMPAPTIARVAVPIDRVAARLYHQGDPARALAPCAQCHGASGEGVGAGNPAIQGQSAAYIAEQLVRWRRVQRRNDPREVMMQISARLTPSEIAGLSAYVAALAPPSVPQVAPGPEPSPSGRRDGE